MKTVLPSSKQRFKDIYLSSRPLNFFIIPNEVVGKGHIYLIYGFVFYFFRICVFCLESNPILLEYNGL